MKATTPPNASLPHAEETGPLAISTRLIESTSTKSRRADRKGPKLNSSGILMPSIIVRTRLPPIPRILKPSRPNLLPVPPTTTPGSNRITSLISLANSRSNLSESIILTVLVKSFTGVSTRDATTVTSSIPSDACRIFGFMRPNIKDEIVKNRNKESRIVKRTPGLNPLLTNLMQMIIILIRISNTIFSRVITPQIGFGCPKQSL